MTETEKMFRSLVEEFAKIEVAKNQAYAERNMLLVLMARMAMKLGWTVGLGLHAQDDGSWDPDWRNILFIDLPTGQASWHFHDSEKHLLQGFPEYPKGWDGHTTELKYVRVLETKP